MFATLFASLFVQGILLGLAALALLAAGAPAAKTLRPAVALPPVGHAGCAASGAAARACAPGPGGSVRGYHTAVQPDRPFAGSHRAPRRRCALHGCAHGHIVPRAELQTGHRTVLERLTVGATRLNLLALAWNLGVLAVALYQFGGYAVWRIRRPPHRTAR